MCPRCVPSYQVKLTQTVVSEAEIPETGELWIADTMVTGFGLRVRPTGAKSFCFRYRTRGGRRGRSRRYTIGPPSRWKVEAARNKARSLLAEVLQGGDPVSDRRAVRKSPSIAEALDLLIAELSEVRKPSTVKHYRWVADTLVKPRVGKLLLILATDRDISDLYRSLSETPTNAREAVKLVRSLYRWAQKRKICPKDMDPTFGLEMQRAEAKERTLTYAELIRLGEVLGSDRTRLTIWPPSILAIRLLLLTGARRGEILGARWDWVDWEEKVLRLPDSKTGKKILTLSSAAMVLLQEAKATSRSPWVVPLKSDQSRPLTGGSIQSTWVSIRRRAGIEDVRIHDLRHTHASFGVEGGETLFVIGKILGHSTTKTTERYAHLGLDPRRRAAEKISGTISAALEGKPRAEVVEISKKVGKA